MLVVWDILLFIFVGWLILFIIGFKIFVLVIVVVIVYNINVI